MAARRLTPSGSKQEIDLDLSEVHAFIRIANRIDAVDLRRRMDGGARKAAGIVARRVRDAAPVDQGVLRRLITVRGGARSVSIQVGKQNSARPANIGWLVEKGHRSPAGRTIKRPFVRGAISDAYQEYLDVMRESLAKFQRRLENRIKRAAKSAR